VPLFLVSESLGSKVLADALACEPNVGSQAVQSALESTTHFFLGANQIPILNSGYLPTGCETTPLAKSLMTLVASSKEISSLQMLVEKIRAQKRRARRSLRGEGAAIRPLKVIAFTDPNDIFSYELREKDILFEEPINIIVSNTATWFGVIEDPLAAHDGYRLNKRVVDYIACGKDAENVLPRERAKCILAPVQ
jgi:hypothetical protein